jgi:hypothetical protein
VSIAVAVSFVLALAVPEVRGPGACPAAARVAEQLRAMLSDADGGAFPPGARLEVRELPAPAGAPVRLELKLEEGTSGREVARRVLPGNGSCAERAQALAVVAANWAAAYRTTGPDLPRPPAAPCRRNRPRSGCGPSEAGAGLHRDQRQARFPRQHLVLRPGQASRWTMRCV